MNPTFGNPMPSPLYSSNPQASGLINNMAQVQQTPPSQMGGVDRIAGDMENNPTIQAYKHLMAMPDNSPILKSMKLYFSHLFQFMHGATDVMPNTDEFIKEMQGMRPKALKDPGFAPTAPQLNPVTPQPKATPAPAVTSGGRGGMLA